MRPALPPVYPCLLVPSAWLHWFSRCFSVTDLCFITCLALPLPLQLSNLKSSEAGSSGPPSQSCLCSLYPLFLNCSLALLCPFNNNNNSLHLYSAFLLFRSTQSALHCEGGGYLLLINPVTCHSAFGSSLTDPDRNKLQVPSLGSLHLM